jgi:hypothetical protein
MSQGPQERGKIKIAYRSKSKIKTKVGNTPIRRQGFPARVFFLQLENRR